MDAACTLWSNGGQWREAGETVTTTDRESTEDAHARRAVVIGSGPNGLAAAIVWAQAGGVVTVFEANEEIGGGARTAALTLPGFLHDLCAAVFPLAVGTDFLPSLPLERYGLSWIHPPLALAHPLDDGTAAVLTRSGERTAEELGEDEGNYRKLIAPVVKDWAAIAAAFFTPPHWPRRPLAVARFGLHAMQPARRVAEKAFTTVAGRALFAGLAAHAMIPLEERGSAAVGMILAATAHRGGWPLARGGAGAITQAMAAHLRELGGEIVTGRRIGDAGELPEHDVAFADVGASALAGIWAKRLPRGYRRKLENFHPGPGVFKLDWALSGPIPWTAHACRGAGTVHLGGTLEEIAASEAASCAARGARASERPFVLLSQASLFDPTRAPAGLHTAWAYCHVPNDSGEDMTQRIENQVERFAPGFRSLILARSARGPKELERGNANLVGGDIGGGRNSLRQLVLRPGWGGYRTPLAGVYLCSSSTPPGGGVHGLCGANAARLALHGAARR